VPDLTHLDELMAAAWAPAIAERHGAWTFRWAHGVTRRANSVFAVGDDDRVPELVASAERWYRERGAPPVFLVSEASAPPALVPHLTGRGYGDGAHTWLAHASSAVVAARTVPGAWFVEVEDRASGAWFERYWSVASTLGVDHPDAAVCRDVLLRPAAPARFVALRDEPGGDVVAVGQVVLDRRWAGVQCMATHPAHRRRGAATAVLHHLAREAVAAGAERTYLAVMADNPGAWSVYEQASYERAHGYRYWAPQIVG
jgi:N-acetylglutamate synthase